jgi:hypothetical protein
MKSLKFLLLAAAMGIAASFAAEAQDAASSGDDAKQLESEIEQCQKTQQLLGELSTKAEALRTLTWNNYMAHPNDPTAKKEFEDANDSASKLGQWSQNVTTRLQALVVRQVNLTWPVYKKKDPQDDSRDAAKDAGGDARQAATDAARQTGADAARGSTDNCPPKGGCH